MVSPVFFDEPKGSLKQTPGWEGTALHLQSIVSVLL